MTKRFGSNVVSIHVARKSRVEAVCAGVDHTDYAGGCGAPRYLPIVGMMDRTVQVILENEWDYAPGYGPISWPRSPVPAAALVQHAMLKVRCRKCEDCLKARARSWVQRAGRELAMAQRTWFVTLTLTPQRQFECLSKARVLAKAGCVDLEELSTADIFSRRVSVINVEITKWLKRVRKNSTSRLRYVLVAEAHKSGDPHFHALVHEVVGSSPLTYRVLTNAWQWGFSSAKLTDPTGTGPAWYVAKYLAKSALARVRASARYGRIE